MKRETKAEWHKRVFGVPIPGARKVGDWMKLRLGDRVSDKADDRHVGELAAIIHSEAKVVWDNGWISFVPVSDLRKEENHDDA